MPETHTTGQPVSRARRHFLAASAAAAGKLAAGAALGGIVLSSSADAGRRAPLKPPKAPKPGKGSNCFLPGTRILTSQGEVPIEDLQIGDLVVTVRGEAKPIKWIGRQSYRKSGPSWHQSVMPIRIARSAIDEGTPHRDLYVSPAHAFLIDGYLMPAMDLVNGTSIVPALPSEMEVIEYFHIVLDTHEVILAEGAPAETLLITSDREYENFANFAEYERLYGTEAVSAMVPFAPKLGMSGRAHLKALLGIGVSFVVDVRDPIQKAYDRIAARAGAEKVVA
jgi:hypothetical protein